MPLTLEAFKEKCENGRKLLLEPEASEAKTEEKASGSSPLKDPPNLLIFRRKSIRSFPDGKKVALYQCTTIDKTLAVPYSNEKPDINLMSIKEGFLDDHMPELKKDPDYDKNPFHDKLVQHPNNYQYVGTHHLNQSPGNEGDLTHHYRAGNKTISVDRKNGAWTYRRESAPHKPGKGMLNTDVEGRIKEGLDEESKPKKKSLSTAKKPAAKKKEEPNKNELKGILGRLQKVAENPDADGAPLKFKDGSGTHCNKMTAIAIMSIHDKLGDLSKAQLHKNINGSKANFEKIAAFAHGYHSDREVEKGKKR